MTQVVEGTGDAPLFRSRARGLRMPSRLPTLLHRFGDCQAVTALFVYLLAALFWDRGVIEHMNSACACSLPGDASQYAWALEWFPHALLHGQSLIHSDAMWAPTGINLAGNAGAPAVAFLVAPVMWLWGPIVTYNVVAIAAPVAAAWSAYWLCHYITKNGWAALLAGATYGFSTYEVAQLVGHINLYVIVCPPLAALCVLRFIDGLMSRRRFEIALAAVLVAQVFISTEVFFEMNVLGVVALLVAWVFGDSDERARIRAAVSPIVASYGLALVLSSWYLIPGTSAGAYAKGAGPAFYPTDALSFLTPPPFTPLGGHVFAPLSSLFPAGPIETDAYIGLPLALISIRLIIVRWPRREVKLLVGLLVFTVLWILGPHLIVAGRTTIWLPYSIVANWPGFNELLQGRVALFLSLICAVMLAMWLANSRRRPVLRWLCGLAALAFVLPNLLHPSALNTGTWTNPVFYKTDMYKRFIRKGETVLPIRWGFLSEAYMWQAEDHMYYNLASGYFMWHPLWNTKLTNDLWNSTPKPGDGPALHAFVIKRRVSDVVVEDGQLRLWAPTLAAAGLRVTAAAGGVTVYHVPSSWGSGQYHRVLRRHPRNEAA
jgi:hypothetical protein